MNNLKRSLLIACIALLALPASVALAQTPVMEIKAGNVEIPTGNLGVGAVPPVWPVHIRRNGSNPTMLLERVGVSSWNFKSTNSGNFAISKLGTAGGEIIVTAANDAVGTLRVLGPVQASAFNIGSSRAIKENFTALDTGELLSRVAELPILRWNLKADPGTPHIGPMAEDFHAAFGVGSGDSHIALNDANGVALAAIQALHGQLQEKDLQIQALMQRMEQLERRLGTE